MDIEKLIAISVTHNASDLHLCSGHLPRWRCDGTLRLIPNQQVVTHPILNAWCRHYLDARQWQNFERKGHIDFAITTQGGFRLRVNLFRQQKGLSLALRFIVTDCPEPQTLRLPFCVNSLLEQRDGLILITGATGSGKSTTLAALVNTLNKHSALHILTLEDPIEFIHQSINSLIQQREIGQHMSTFEDGLRAALREDPDVILLGELRDNESVRLALTAAETGHLVLATLHARGASQAIDRLVDIFLAEEKNLVRYQLASSLRAVMAQRLVPATEGRVGLFEVLINTPAVASLIREGKNHQIPSLLQTGRQVGMQTFEQSLKERENEGLIMVEGHKAIGHLETNFLE